jgi:hypothetical protein
MATTRDALSADLFKLSNYVEGKLADILRELFAASMTDEAQDVVYHGCTFISALREASSGKGGDE